MKRRYKIIGAVVVGVAVSLVCLIKFGCSISQREARKALAKADTIYIENARITDRTASTVDKAVSIQKVTITDKELINEIASALVFKGESHGRTRYGSTEYIALTLYRKGRAFFYITIIPLPPEPAFDLVCITLADNWGRIWSVESDRGLFDVVERILHESDKK